MGKKYRKGEAAPEKVLSKANTVDVSEDIRMLLLYSPERGETPKSPQSQVYIEQHSDRDFKFLLWCFLWGGVFLYIGGVSIFAFSYPGIDWQDTQEILDVFVMMLFVPLLALGPILVVVGVLHVIGWHWGAWKVAIHRVDEHGQDSVSVHLVGRGVWCMLNSLSPELHVSEISWKMRRLYHDELEFISRPITKRYKALTHACWLRMSYQDRVRWVVLSAEGSHEDAVRSAHRWMSTLAMKQDTIHEHQGEPVEIVIDRSYFNDLSLWVAYRLISYKIRRALRVRDPGEVWLVSPEPTKIFANCHEMGVDVTKKRDTLYYPMRQLYVTMEQRLYGLPPNMILAERHVASRVSPRLRFRLMHAVLWIVCGSIAVLVSVMDVESPMNYLVGVLVAYGVYLALWVVLKLGAAWLRSVGGSPLSIHESDKGKITVHQIAHPKSWCALDELSPTLGVGAFDWVDPGNKAISQRDRERDLDVQDVIGYSHACWLRISHKTRARFVLLSIHRSEEESIEAIGKWAGDLKLGDDVDFDAMKVPHEIQLYSDRMRKFGEGPVNPYTLSK